MNTHQVILRDLSAYNLFQAIANSDEPVCLIVGKDEIGKVELKCFIDDTETVHVVELRSDGTWVLRTHIEI